MDEDTKDVQDPAGPALVPQSDIVALSVPVAASDDIAVSSLVPQIETVTLAVPVVTDDNHVPANLEKPPVSTDDLTDQPLMGSSRISGGAFRGLARGNVPNHADFISSTLGLESVMGEVCLYVTDKYPRDVKFESLKGDSEMVVMVKVVDHMVPILEKVACKFSIIQSESNLD